MKTRLCALGLWLMTFTSQASAQDLMIRDVFKQMPASLLPTLSENNLLDMLDFRDSKMKAEVTNRLGGKSEMTLLTDTTLSIRMSEALKVDMLLLKSGSSESSNNEIICMIETFGRDSLSLSRLPEPRKHSAFLYHFVASTIAISPALRVRSEHNIVKKSANDP